MYIPHFLCPVIYQWTFSLLPPPGYCTYSWYNHGCSNISPIYFQFFYIYPEVRHIGHIINLCLIIQGTTILFSSDWTILHSHQLCPGMKFFHLLVNTCYFLLLLLLFIIAILMEMGWYHMVGLICISLVVSDFEHFFVCLLGICISSLRKYQVLCPSLVS